MKAIIENITTRVESCRRYNEESNDYSFLSKDEREITSTISCTSFINKHSFHSEFTLFHKDLPKNLNVGDEVEITLTKLEN